MAYPSLEVQDVFLCCQLLGVYLAHLRLQLVYLLNLTADRRLEKVLQTAGLVPYVVLEDEGGVFELTDLTLHDFSQVVEVDSVFVNCVPQKSPHLLDKKSTTSSREICSVRFMSVSVCSLTSKRMESSMRGSAEKELF